MFDILKYVGNGLNVAKETNTQVKCFCPVCGQNNLAINKVTEKWCCFRWL